MGVDLTTGTGWPFGGPWVEEAQASAGLENVTAKAEGEKPFTLALPKGKVEILSAWPENGEAVDLLPRVKGGKLEWTPPAGTWKIHGLVSRHAIQKVKRSAPGGAGSVLDPYSTSAMDAYLKPFSVALDRPEVAEPRAHFHDSFEYYNAAWTDELFARFKDLRGYDLRSQLPAFQGEGAPDTIARVRADYRETMSDLHREYLMRWHDWAKARGSLTRNQAHGSPGNLLDHYAVADIPETEIFRRVDEAQIPMLQFASSAAHVTGKPLSSAETFTWLDEHFQVTPAKLKEAADFVWLGGVNHIIFHGIPYSPEDAPWPGWLFYASTNMGPNGGLWHDLPAFSLYLARCQAVLQSGKPDAEVLVYFPMHDLWQDGSKELPLFTVHNQESWLHRSTFYKEAMGLWSRGVPCDFISDRQLESCKASDHQIETGGGSYKAIIVPETRYMPLATAKRLLELKAQGAQVIFHGKLPAETPGFKDAEAGRKELADLFKDAQAGDAAPQEVKEEPMAALGLRFVRRRQADGWSYFIVNRSGKDFDGKVSFATPLKSAVMFDPMSGRSGVAAADGGIRLVLTAGESRILRTFSDKTASGPAWRDLETAGGPVELAGTWKVKFLEGGPELPADYETASLDSWTKREGASYRNFSGTALYRLEFNWQGAPSALLDLGKVGETARVSLNGSKATQTSWSPPHRLSVHLEKGRNSLEVEVTNLAANRIADLDRRKVPWKAFHEINFVNIDYKPFDASGWEPLPSGLMGPVTLVPLR